MAAVVSILLFSFLRALPTSCAFLTTTGVISSLEVLALNGLSTAMHWHQQQH